MSESPASSTAIVEHLNSFPHAVPSSICGRCVSIRIPSKALAQDSFAGLPLDTQHLEVDVDVEGSMMRVSLKCLILRCCRRSDVRSS